MASRNLLFRTIIKYNVISDGNNCIQAMAIGLPVVPLVLRSPNCTNIWSPYPVRDHGGQRKRKPNDTKLKCSILFSDVSLSTELFFHAFFNGLVVGRSLGSTLLFPECFEAVGRYSQTTLGPIIWSCLCQYQSSISFLYLVSLTLNLMFFTLTSEPCLRARSYRPKTACMFIISASSPAVFATSYRSPGISSAGWRKCKCQRLILQQFKLSRGD